MGKDLKKFLGSTIKAVEQTKREIEAEKEREEKQLDIQKSMRQAELVEKRQREDAKRRVIDASIEQSDKALLSYMVHRQKVFTDLDTLKTQIYSQINENPDMEQVLINSWQVQGHKITSLSEAFKAMEKAQLERLKSSISEDLGELARARFYALSLQVKKEGEESITDLLWSMNRPQGPPQEDYTGLIITNAVDQISKTYENSQNQIMQLMYGYSPAPQAPETRNERTINEILSIVNPE